MKIKTAQNRGRFIRIIAGAVVIMFTTTSAAFPAPVTPSAGLETARIEVSVPSAISIPDELGSVQIQRIDPKAGRVIVLVQDAHAVTDAQENIRKLLEHFQRNYAAGTFFVEGAKGALDPTLFRAYPDDKIKKQVLAGYFNAAELSGSEMASVLNEREGDFSGLEDWDLYSANYLAFQRAQAVKGDIKSKLKAVKEALDKQKEKLFSEKLNEFLQAWGDFRAERTSLLDLLLYLSNFVELVKGKPEYSELAKLIDTVGYEKSGKQEALEPIVKQMGEEFKKKFGRKMDVRDRTNFFMTYQNFMTGKLSAGEMLLYMTRAGAKQGFRPKLTPQMRRLLGHAQVLAELRGSRLFDELQRFLPEAALSLVRNRDEKELLLKYEKMFLLEDLADLELTHDQLAELVKPETLNPKSERMSNDKNSKKENLAIQNLNHLDLGFVSELGFRDSDLKEMLRPALEFYDYALRRDRVFYDRIRKAPAGAKTVVMIAGGFHTSGLERILNEQGESYAVVTPKIASLTGAENYFKVMAGELSYKDYLQTTYYDALMRHAVRKLTENLKEPEFRSVLKLWRDNVIRDLAEKRRITDLGRYTRHFDELSFVYQERFGKIQKPRSRDEILNFVQKQLEKFRDDTLASIWSQFEGQLKTFTAGLQGLVDKKQLDTEHVAGLLGDISRSKPVMVATPAALSQATVPGVEIRPEFREAVQNVFAPRTDIQNALGRIAGTATPATNVSGVVAQMLNEAGARAETRIATGEVKTPGPAQTQKVIADVVKAATPAGTSPSAVAAGLLQKMPVVSTPSEIPGPDSLSFDERRIRQSSVAEIPAAETSQRPGLGEGETAVPADALWPETMQVPIRRAEVRMLPEMLFNIPQESSQNIEGSVSSRVIWNDIYSKLSTRDRERMGRLLRNGNNKLSLLRNQARTWGETKEFKRTILFDLSDPVSHNGTIYKTIKIKGGLIAPKGPLKTLGEGDAGQPGDALVVEGGKGTVAKRGNRVIGVVTQKGAQWEYYGSQALLQKGYSANYPLGYGIYTSRESEPVKESIGYYVSLLEDPEDLRFFQNVRDRLYPVFKKWQRGALGEEERTEFANWMNQRFSRYGEALRTLNRDFIHGYAHSGNVSISDEDVKFHDNDDLMPLEKLNPEDRFVYFVNEVFMLLEAVHEFEREDLAGGRPSKMYPDAIKTEVLRFLAELNIDLQKAALTGYFQNSFNDPRISLISSSELLDRLILSGEELSNVRNPVLDLFRDEFSRELKIRADASAVPAPSEISAAETPSTSLPPQNVGGQAGQGRETPTARSESRTVTSPVGKASGLRGLEQERLRWERIVELQNRISLLSRNVFSGFLNAGKIAELKKEMGLWQKNYGTIDLGKDPAQTLKDVRKAVRELSGFEQAALAEKFFQEVKRKQEEEYFKNRQAYAIVAAAADFVTDDFGIRFPDVRALEVEMATIVHLSTPGEETEALLFGVPVGTVRLLESGKVSEMTRLDQAKAEMIMERLGFYLAQEAGVDFPGTLRPMPEGWRERSSRVPAEIGDVLEPESLELSSRRTRSETRAGQQTDQPVSTVPDTVQKAELFGSRRHTNPNDWFAAIRGVLTKPMTLEALAEALGTTPPTVNEYLKAEDLKDIRYRVRPERLYRVKTPLTNRPLSRERSLYAVLGVPWDVAPGEIREAYLAKVRQWHPAADHDPDQKLREEATKRMNEINEAYSILSDKEKRRNYDSDFIPVATRGFKWDSVEMFLEPGSRLDRKNGLRISPVTREELARELGIDPLDTGLILRGLNHWLVNKEEVLPFVLTENPGARLAIPEQTPDRTAEPQAEPVSSADLSKLAEDAKVPVTEMDEARLFVLNPVQRRVIDLYYGIDVPQEQDFQKIADALNADGLSTVRARQPYTAKSVPRIKETAFESLREHRDGLAWLSEDAGRAVSEEELANTLKDRSDELEVLRYWYGIGRQRLADYAAVDAAFREKGMNAKNGEQEGVEALRVIYKNAIRHLTDGIKLKGRRAEWDGKNGEAHLASDIGVPEATIDEARLYVLTPAQRRVLTLYYGLGGVERVRVKDIPGILAKEGNPIAYVTVSKYLFKDAPELLRTYRSGDVWLAEDAGIGTDVLAYRMATRGLTEDEKEVLAYRYGIGRQRLPDFEAIDKALREKGKVVRYQGSRGNDLEGVEALWRISTNAMRKLSADDKKLRGRRAEKGGLELLSEDTGIPEAEIATKIKSGTWLSMLDRIQYQIFQLYYGLDGDMEGLVEIAEILSREEGASFRRNDINDIRRRAIALLNTYPNGMAWLANDLGGISEHEAKNALSKLPESERGIFELRYGIGVQRLPNRGTGGEIDDYTLLAAMKKRGLLATVRTPEQMEAFRDQARTHLVRLIDRARQQDEETVREALAAPKEPVKGDRASYESYFEEMLKLIGGLDGSVVWVKPDNASRPRQVSVYDWISRKTPVERRAIRSRLDQKDEKGRPVPFTAEPILKTGGLKENSLTPEECDQYFLHRLFVAPPNDFRNRRFFSDAIDLMDARLSELERLGGKEDAGGQPAGPDFSVPLPDAEEAMAGARSESRAGVERGEPGEAAEVRALAGDGLFKMTEEEREALRLSDTTVQALLAVLGDRYPGLTKALQEKRGDITADEVAEMVFEGIYRSYRSVGEGGTLKESEVDPDVAKYSAAGRPEGSIEALDDDGSGWNKRGVAGFVERVSDLQQALIRNQNLHTFRIALVNVQPRKALIDALDRWIREVHETAGAEGYYKIPARLTDWNRRDPVTFYFFSDNAARPVVPDGKLTGLAEITSRFSLDRGETGLPGYGKFAKGVFTAWEPGNREAGDFLDALETGQTGESEDMSTIRDALREVLFEKFWDPAAKQYKPSLGQWAAALETRSIFNRLSEGLGKKTEAAVKATPSGLIGVTTPDGRGLATATWNAEEGSELGRTAENVESGAPAARSEARLRSVYGYLMRRVLMPAVIALWLLVPSFARAQTPYSVRLDPAMSMNAGAENFYSGYRALDDYVINPLAGHVPYMEDSAIGRFVKLFGVDYMAAEFMWVVQHEASHGVRMREAGFGDSYGFDFSPGLSFSRFRFLNYWNGWAGSSGEPTPDESIAISGAGMEGSQVLSARIRESMFRYGATYQAGLPYVISHLDLSDYILGSTEPDLHEGMVLLGEGEEIVTGGDVDDYFVSMTEKYGAAGRGFDWDDLRNLAWWNAADPATWYSVAGALRYGATGQRAFALPSVLPHTGGRLTPLGPSYDGGVLFRTGTVVHDVYGNYGRGTEGNFYGAGWHFGDIRLGDKYFLATQFDGWRQSGQLGFALGLELNRKITENFSVGVGASGKTDGDLKGESSDAGVTGSVRVQWTPGRSETREQRPDWNQFFFSLEGASDRALKNIVSGTYDASWVANSFLSPRGTGQPGAVAVGDGDMPFIQTLAATEIFLRKFLEPLSSGARLPTADDFNRYLRDARKVPAVRDRVQSLLANEKVNENPEAIAALTTLRDRLSPAVRSESRLDPLQRRTLESGAGVGEGRLKTRAADQEQAVRDTESEPRADLRAWLDGFINRLAPRQVAGKRVFPIDTSKIPDFQRFVFIRGAAFGSRYFWSKNRPYQMQDFVPWHTGIDLFEYEKHDGSRGRLTVGTRVDAISDGRVLHVSPKGGDIYIQAPDGKIIVYAHLVPSVVSGQQVHAGDELGKLSSNVIKDAHLHLEILAGRGDFPEKQASEDEDDYLDRIDRHLKNFRVINPAGYWPGLFGNILIEDDPDNIAQRVSAARVRQGKPLAAARAELRTKAEGRDIWPESLKNHPEFVSAPNFMRSFLGNFWKNEFLNMRPGSIVLDLGTGNGFVSGLAAAMSGKQFEVWGGDFGQPRIIPDGVNFRRSDMGNFTETTDIPRDIDLVTAQFSLEYGEDPDRILGQLEKSMKSGGRGIFLMHSQGSYATKQAGSVLDQLEAIEKSGFFPAAADYLENTASEAAKKSLESKIKELEGIVALRQAAAWTTAAGEEPHDLIEYAIAQMKEIMNDVSKTQIPAARKSFDFWQSRWKSLKWIDQAMLRNALTEEKLREFRAMLKRHGFEMVRSEPVTMPDGTLVGQLVEMKKELLPAAMPRPEARSESREGKVSEFAGLFRNAAGLFGEYLFFGATQLFVFSGTLGSAQFLVAFLTIFDLIEAPSRVPFFQRILERSWGAWAYVAAKYSAAALMFGATGPLIFLAVDAAKTFFGIDFIGNMHDYLSRPAAKKFDPIDFLRAIKRQRPDLIPRFRPGERSELRTESWTPEQVRGLTRDELTNMRGGIRDFSEEQISWLTPRQISWLPMPDLRDKQISALTDKQVRALTQAQIGTFEIGMFLALLDGSFQAMTRTQRDTFFEKFKEEIDETGRLSLAENIWDTFVKGAMTVGIAALMAWAAKEVPALWSVSWKLGLFASVGGAALGMGGVAMLSKLIYSPPLSPRRFGNNVRDRWIMPGTRIHIRQGRQDADGRTAILNAVFARLEGETDGAKTLVFYRPGKDPADGPEKISLSSIRSIRVRFDQIGFRDIFLRTVVYPIVLLAARVGLLKEEPAPGSAPVGQEISELAKPRSTSAPNEPIRQRSEARETSVRAESRTDTTGRSELRVEVKELEDIGAVMIKPSSLNDAVPVVGERLEAQASIDWKISGGRQGFSEVLISMIPGAEPVLFTAPRHPNKQHPIGITHEDILFAAGFPEEMKKNMVRASLDFNDEGVLEEIFMIPSTKDLVVSPDGAVDAGSKLSELEQLGAFLYDVFRRMGYMVEDLDKVKISLDASIESLFGEEDVTLSRLAFGSQPLSETMPGARSELRVGPRAGALMMAAALALAAFSAQGAAQRMSAVPPSTAEIVITKRGSRSPAQSLAENPVVKQLGLPRYAARFVQLSDGFENHGNKIWSGQNKKDLVCLGMVADLTTRDLAEETADDEAEARKDLGSMRMGISVTEGGKSLAAQQKGGPAASTEMIEPRSAIDAFRAAKFSKRADLQKVMFDGLTPNQTAFVNSLFGKGANNPANQATMKQFLRDNDFQNRTIILYLYWKLATHDLPLPSAGNLEQQAGTYQIAWAPGLYEYPRTLGLFMYAGQVYDILEKISRGERITEQDVRRERQADEFSTRIESIAVSMRRAERYARKGDTAAAGRELASAENKYRQIQKITAAFNLLSDRDLIMNATESEINNRFRRLKAGLSPQGSEGLPTVAEIRALAEESQQPAMVSTRQPDRTAPSVASRASRIVQAPPATIADRSAVGRTTPATDFDKGLPYPKAEESLAPTPYEPMPASEAVLRVLQKGETWKDLGLIFGLVFAGFGAWALRPGAVPQEVRSMSRSRRSGRSEMRHIARSEGRMVNGEGPRVFPTITAVDAINRAAREKLEELRKNNEDRPVFIFVDGPTGSGKNYFARRFFHTNPDGTVAMYDTDNLPAIHVEEDDEINFPWDALLSRMGRMIWDVHQKRPKDLMVIVGMQGKEFVTRLRDTANVKIDPRIPIDFVVHLHVDESTQQANIRDRGRPHEVADIDTWIRNNAMEFDPLFYDFIVDNSMAARNALPEAPRGRAETRAQELPIETFGIENSSPAVDAVSFQLGDTGLKLEIRNRGALGEGGISEIGVKIMNRGSEAGDVKLENGEMSLIGPLQAGEKAEGKNIGLPVARYPGVQGLTMRVTFENGKAIVENLNPDFPVTQIVAGRAEMREPGAKGLKDFFVKLWQDESSSRRTAQEQIYSTTFSPPVNSMVMLGFVGTALGIFKVSFLAVSVLFAGMGLVGMNTALFAGILAPVVAGWLMPLFLSREKIQAKFEGAWIDLQKEPLDPRLAAAMKLVPGVRESGFMEAYDGGKTDDGTILLPRAAALSKNYARYLITRRALDLDYRNSFFALRQKIGESDFFTEFQHYYFRDHISRETLKRFGMYPDPVVGAYMAAEAVFSELLAVSGMMTAVIKNALQNGPSAAFSELWKVLDVFNQIYKQGKSVDEIEIAPLASAGRQASSAAHFATLILATCGTGIAGAFYLLFLANAFVFNISSAEFFTGMFLKNIITTHSFIFLPLFFWAGVSLIAGSWIAPLRARLKADPLAANPTPGVGKVEGRSEMRGLARELAALVRQVDDRGMADAARWFLIHFAGADDMGQASEDAILNALNALKNKQVLEIGPGDHVRFHEWLEANGFPKGVLHGIDPYLKPSKAGERYVLGRFPSAVPAEWTGKFDAVVADLVFIYLTDPKQVGETLRRVLKPGGYIYAAYDVDNETYTKQYEAYFKELGKYFSRLPSDVPGQAIFLNNRLETWEISEKILAARLAREAGKIKITSTPSLSEKDARAMNNAEFGKAFRAVFAAEDNVVPIMDPAILKGTETDGEGFLKKFAAAIVFHAPEEESDPIGHYIGHTRPSVMLRRFFKSPEIYDEKLATYNVLLKEFARRWQEGGIRSETRGLPVLDTVEGLKKIADAMKEKDEIGYNEFFGSLGAAKNVFRGVNSAGLSDALALKRVQTKPGSRESARWGDYRTAILYGGHLEKEMYPSEKFPTYAVLFELEKDLAERVHGATSDGRGIPNVPLENLHRAWVVKVKDRESFQKGTVSLREVWIPGMAPARTGGERSETPVPPEDVPKQPEAGRRDAAVDRIVNAAWSRIGGGADVEVYRSEALPGVVLKIVPSEVTVNGTLTTNSAEDARAVRDAYSVKLPAAFRGRVAESHVLDLTAEQTAVLEKALNVKMTPGGSFVVVQKAYAAFPDTVPGGFNWNAYFDFLKRVYENGFRYDDVLKPSDFGYPEGQPDRFILLDRRGLQKGRWNVTAMRKMLNELRNRTLKFDSPAAKQIFWEASADFLGELMKNQRAAQDTGRSESRIDGLVETDVKSFEVVSRVVEAATEEGMKAELGAAVRNALLEAKVNYEQRHLSMKRSFPELEDRKPPAWYEIIGLIQPYGEGFRFVIVPRIGHVKEGTADLYREIPHKDLLEQYPEFRGPGTARLIVFLDPEGRKDAKTTVLFGGSSARLPDGEDVPPPFNDLVLNVLDGLSDLVRQAPGRSGAGEVRSDVVKDLAGLAEIQPEKVSEQVRAAGSVAGYEKNLRAQGEAKRAELRRVFDMQIGEVMVEMRQQKDLPGFIQGTGFENAMRVFGQGIMLVISTIRIFVAGTEPSVFAAEQVIDAVPLREQEIRALIATIKQKTLEFKGPKVVEIMNHPGASADDVLKTLQGGTLLDRLVVLHRKDQPLGGAWRELGIPVTPLVIDGVKTPEVQVAKAIQGASSNGEVPVGFLTENLPIGSPDMLSVLAELNQLSNPDLKELVCVTARLAFTVYASASPKKRSEFRIKPELLLTAVNKLINAKIPGLAAAKNGMLVFAMAMLVQAFAARESIDRAA